MYHPLPMNQHMSDIEPGAPVPQTLQKDPAPALLFEMMRSFVTLAHTLNLSHAVAELVSTRQTVRRHIQQLEEAMGAPLFTIENRRYSLTKVGLEALPEARDILDRGKLWLDGKTRHADGMLRLSHEEPNGWSFHQQQKAKPFAPCAPMCWCIAIRPMDGFVPKWGRNPFTRNGGAGPTRAAA